MRTLFSKTLAAVMIGTIFAGATWADQRQTPAEIQDQINAQISITSDDIRQVLKKMEEKSQTNDGMKHADYLVKAPIERDNAQKALDAFDNYLRETIFTEVRAVLVNYNNVYKSDAYSPEQKSVMLTNTAVVVRGFFLEESKKYRAALSKLYAALGPGYAAYLVNINNSSPSVFFNTSIMPAMVAGCYSFSCVNFSSTDEVLFYTLVHYLFGNAIVFKGADGTEFVLNEYNGENYGESYVAILSNESFLPQEIKSLPFDIDSTAYAQAVAKNPPKSNETCKSHWGHKCSN